MRAEFHTLLLVSLYLLFAGHNQPGGGFAGGLVASCAFCLLFVAGGEPSAAAGASTCTRPPSWASGCCSPIVTGVIPLLLGGEFLESAIIEGDPAVIGQVKGSSVLFFDTGVYLVVLGMVLLLLEQFGTADGDRARPGGHGGGGSR